MDDLTLEDKNWTRGFIESGYEKKLFATAFSHYGSLYYRQSLAKEEQSDTLLTGKADLEDEFCIGPIAYRSFWYKERANLSISRGPCKAPLNCSNLSSQNARGLPLLHQCT